MQEKSPMALPGHVSKPCVCIMCRVCNMVWSRRCQEIIAGSQDFHKHLNDLRKYLLQCGVGKMMRNAQVKRIMMVATIQRA